MISWSTDIQNFHVPSQKLTTCKQFTRVVNRIWTEIKNIIYEILWVSYGLKECSNQSSHLTLFHLNWTEQDSATLLLSHMTRANTGAICADISDAVVLMTMARDEVCRWQRTCPPGGLRPGYYCSPPRGQLIRGWLQLALLDTPHSCRARCTPGQLLHLSTSHATSTLINDHTCTSDGKFIHLVQILLSKYTIKRWFNFPPYLFSVHTLPWETLQLWKSQSQQ